MIVPAFLSHLPIDPDWQLPIPYSVSVVNGVAQFKTPVLSHMKHIVDDKLCSVCGRQIGSLAWFIGNPEIALQNVGLIIEPPMHRPCAEFAVKTCPALAQSKHRNAVTDGKTFKRLPAEKAATGIRPVRRAKLQSRIRSRPAC